jgi:hypothetical protein
MAIRRFQPTVVNFVVAGMVAACAIYFFGGHLWRDISIARHPQMTQGIVTGESRGALVYHYTVNGHDYSGSGIGDFDRSYPPGTTLKVRYSRLHPSFSTIDGSLLTEKQLLCGVAIFGGILLVVRFSCRRKQAA